MRENPQNASYFVNCVHSKARSNLTHPQSPKGQTLLQIQDYSHTTETNRKNLVSSKFLLIRFTKFISDILFGACGRLTSYRWYESLILWILKDVIVTKEYFGKSQHQDVRKDNRMPLSMTFPFVFIFAQLWCGYVNSQVFVLNSISSIRDFMQV